MQLQELDSLVQASTTKVNLKYQNLKKVISPYTYKLKSFT